MAAGCPDRTLFAPSGMTIRKTAAVMVFIDLPQACSWPSRNTGCGCPVLLTINGDETREKYRFAWSQSMARALSCVLMLKVLPLLAA